MQKREMLIVRHDSPMLAICRACNEQFKSGAPADDAAKAELRIMFDAHKCLPKDSSQNALRIVREATEGK